MKLNYPIAVPHGAVEALKLLEKPSNPALLFDRFTPYLSQANDKEKAKWKNEALQLVLKHTANKEALDNYKARWEKVVEQAHTKPFNLKTDWRLIAGLGRKGALEVGFTFHRYGFAMLPGSSVKGLARAWAFYAIAEGLKLEGREALSKLDELLSEEDEKKHSESLKQLSPTKEASETIKVFREVFGTTAQAGKAIFFDAIPTKPARLKLDIMNPHYPDYYSDTSSSVYPTNWQSPNPIFFLTVDEGQEFCFAVGWREGDSPVRKQAEGWLKDGLLNLGVGAKTSAGYGYFRP